MTTEEKRIKIAEACGWEYDALSCQMVTTYGDDIAGFDWPSLDALREARESIRHNLDLRVKYMGNLRVIVGKRCEVNKMGAPLVTDFDCIDSTAEEQAEAFGLTLGLWRAGE